MESIKENFIGLLSIVILVGGYIWFKKNERKQDEKMIYTKDNVGGIFRPENGLTYLVFKYAPNTQFRKKQFILDNYKQGEVVTNQNGNEFIVSELVSEVEYENPDKLIFKGEAIIKFKVISKTEIKQSGMHFGNIYAPVQVATNGSTASQYISDSSFSSKIKEVRDIMIDNGVSEEDIDVVINNPEDENVKQSFLNKYGLDLAKLSVDISGKIISLLTFLQS